MNASENYAENDASNPSGASPNHAWLLLRGLGREQRHWGAFPETLARATRARVLTLDLPGFGTENLRRSPSTVHAIMEDVRARFLEERARDRSGARFSVLGISLGGMIALEWCAQHPHDFDACVTVNTSARPSPAFDRFRLAEWRAILGATSSDPHAKERATLSLTSDRDSAELDALASTHAEWARERPPNRASVALQLFAASRFSAPRSIRPKLLVLASRTDRLVAYRCSERIAKSANAAHLALSERGGHDLALDEPSWISEKIAAWLARSATASLATSL